MSQLRTFLKSAYFAQILCLLFSFFLISICAFFCIEFFNGFTPAIYTSEDRITHVITWLNPPALTLVIGMYMQCSWQQSYDEDASDVEVAQNKKQLLYYKDYITNTTTHLFVFTLALLQFALFLPETLLGLVPIFAIIFCLSRLIYITGYLMHPRMHLLGAYMSLFVSIIMLLYGFKILVNWGAIFNAPIS